MEEIDYEDLTYDKTVETYGIAIEEERLLWESEYVNKYIFLKDALNAA